VVMVRRTSCSRTLAVTCRLGSKRAQLKEAIEQLPKTLNPAKKRLAPGRQPRRIIRRAALARFNPNDPRGPAGQQVFGTTEALDFPWDDRVGALMIGGLPASAMVLLRPGRTASWSRIANRYAQLGRGDVIFVQRSGGGPAVHHPTLGGRRFRILLWLVSGWLNTWTPNRCSELRATSIGSSRCRWFSSMSPSDSTTPVRLGVRRLLAHPM
jgi:hypothetical protein